MNAPRYIESNKNILRDREHSLKKHYTKLAEIKNKASRFIDNSEPFRKKPESMKNHVEIMRTEEQIWIDRANKIIQGKLQKIEKRKSQWNDLYNSFTPKGNFKSSYKKVEAKIHKENMILAKKLVNPVHDLNTRQLEEDYKQYSEYKKQLSKKHTLMTSQELTTSRDSKFEEDYKQYLEYKKQLSKKHTLMTSQELTTSRDSKDELRSSRNTGSLSPTSLPSINQNGLRSIKHEDMFINRPSAKIEQRLEDILRHRWKEGYNEKPKKNKSALSPYEASMIKKKSKAGKASSRSNSKAATSSKEAKLNHQRSVSVELTANSAEAPEESVEIDKEQGEARIITNEK